MNRGPRAAGWRARAVEGAGRGPRAVERGRPSAGREPRAWPSAGRGRGLRALAADHGCDRDSAHNPLIN